MFDERGPLADAAVFVDGKRCGGASAILGGKENFIIVVEAEAGGSAIADRLLVDQGKRAIFVYVEGGYASFVIVGGRIETSLV